MHAPVEGHVDVGLFQFYFTRLVVSRKRVLELQFGIDGDAVGEAVIHQKHPAVEVNRVVLIAVQVEVQLAVAAQGGVLKPVVTTIAGAAVAVGFVNSLFPFRSHLRGSCQDSKTKDKGPRGPPDLSGSHSKLIELIALTGGGSCSYLKGLELFIDTESQQQEVSQFNSFFIVTYL